MESATETSLDWKQLRVKRGKPHLVQRQISEWIARPQFAGRRLKDISNDTPRQMIVARDDSTVNLAKAR